MISSAILATLVTPAKLIKTRPAVDKIADCPAPKKLAKQVTGFIQELRDMDLYKLPGVAETLDWTTALVALDQYALNPVIVDETLGAVLKYQDDVDKIKGEQTRLILERVQAGVD